MGIFGKMKKKEDKLDMNARVKVLGTGCSNCKRLEENANKALEELGIDEKATHLTDLSLIAKYGVMTTPALIVDEKVVSNGKVLKPEELVEIFQEVF